MISKGSFENHFKDYSLDGAKNILSESQHGISEIFQSKLENFKNAKLNILTNDMQSDIFYDGTVYTGSAGLALYYLSCAVGKNENNHDILKTALNYIDIDNLKGRRISFLCGDAGPLAVATVISHKLGTRRPENFPDYKSLAHRLMSLISLLNESPDELLYGKSGYLYALLFVNKNIPGKEVIPASHIEKVIKTQKMCLTCKVKFPVSMKKFLADNGPDTSGPWLDSVIIFKILTEKLASARSNVT